MSYQIQYDPQLSKKYPIKQKGSPQKTVLRVVVILLACSVLIGLIGRGEIPSFLIPGDAIVTRNALQTMSEQLREGESLGECITAFCVEIIRHGTNG